MAAGFSFLEIGLVLIILVVALLPIYGLFSGASRGLYQTLPYQQAVFLAEKALEEIRVAAEEDPHSPARLERTNLADHAPIVGGAHSVFSRLEDSAEPWGRILEGVDWSIQPEVGPLYEQAKPLFVQMKTSRSLVKATAASETDCLVRLTWDDRRGRSMVYELATPVRTWTTRPPAEAIAPEEMKAALRRALAPGVDGDLSRLAAERGADPGRFEAFATLLAVASMAQDMLQVREREINDLLARRAASGDAVERARATGHLGSREESVVAGLLALVPPLRVALESVREGLPRGSLGMPAPSETQRALAVKLVGHALVAIPVHLHRALDEYTLLANVAPVPAGWRVESHLRLWRCAKVATLGYPLPTEALLRPLSGHLLAHYDGRMPHLWQFFLVEAGGLDRLRSMEWNTFAAILDDYWRCRKAFLGAAVRLYLYQST